jgi:hypothetical protein
MKKFLYLLVFAFLISLVGTQVKADSPRWCAGQTDSILCTAPWMYGVTDVPFSPLEPNCIGTVYYYWRICNGALQLEISCVTCTNACANISNSDILACAFANVTEYLYATFYTKGLQFGTMSKYNQGSCWKKVQFGPMQLDSVTMVPCDDSCCLYTYKVELTDPTQPISQTNLTITLQSIKTPSILCDTINPGPCQPSCFTYLPARIGSLESETESPQFEIYPNPATDNITIKCNGQYQIKIIDCYGNIVDELSVSKSTDYDLSKLTSGLYTIIANTDGAVISRKIIVIK